MAHPITIFYVYADTDETLRQQLEKHLALLQRQGVLTSWQPVLAGALWEQEREQAFNETSLILPLVSADFLASDVCYEEQMQRALERQKRGEVQVLPILVRPVEMTNAPFTHLPMVPTNGKSVTLWSNQDAAWTHITEGIRCVLEGKPLPVVQEKKEEARYTTENQQAVYGQTIGEHNVIHHHYPPVSSPPDPVAVPVKPIWMVPYPRNPFFTGRRALLTQLAETFHTGHPAALLQPQAISGLGGIGKTQIAIEYAYRYRQDYQVVLWVQADTRESLVSGYVAIARLLNLFEKDEQDQMITVKAVVRWLETHAVWLLILDNADDLSLVGEFLPSLFEGHIVLTTRTQSMGRLARRVGVDILDRDSGALFLLYRAGLVTPDVALEHFNASDLAVARVICEELGGLPLALDQAGAYIEETQCSLSQYLQLSRTRRAVLLQHRGGRVQDHPEPVATTWSLSFEKIEQQHPDAANLLRLCAYLSPDAIPERLITQGASYPGSLLEAVAVDPIVLNEVVAALGAYSLLKREARKEAFSVHRLVQSVLQDAMNATMRRDWTQRAVHVVNAAFPEVEFTTWAQCEQYLSHAWTCANWIEQEQFTSPEAARLLLMMGWYLKDRIRYKEAEPLVERALEISRTWDLSPPGGQSEVLSHARITIAQMLTVLAGIYDASGKYAQAEPLYQQAFALYEKYLGPEHSYTARSVNNLAGLYNMQGRYAEAELLYQQALAIREKTLAPEHLDIASSLNNLAYCYEDQGKYVEAEMLIKRALVIYEQLSGPDHPDTANSVNNLAELSCQQGKYTEAEPLYRRAQSIYEQHLGFDHPDTANVLNNLAALYCEQKKYLEAESLLRQALTICEQRLGPDHPNTANSLYNLARLYDRQERAIEANSLYERALAIRKQQLGHHHPHTRLTQEKYSDLLRKMGEETKALQLESKNTTVS
jgi:tetratricopeptide (TPR) repeat protein